MKAILYDNTGTEVRRGNYPKADMSLVEDLPVGYEWKLIIEDERPIFNIKKNVERVETNTNIANATYPHLKEFRISYVETNKTVGELEAIIDSYETQSNQALFPQDVFQKNMILVAAILDRKANGLNITAKMQTILDRLGNIALKVWENESVVATKKQEVANTGDTDLETNWVKQ